MRANSTAQVQRDAAQGDLLTCRQLAFGDDPVVEVGSVAAATIQVPEIGSFGNLLV